MKRVLVFVGLKVAEISAFVFIPWGIGLWNPLGFRDEYVWLTGLGNICLGFIVPTGVIGIFILIISINWEWSKKIMDRK